MGNDKLKVNVSLDIDGVIADTETALKSMIERDLGIPAKELNHSGVYNNMYQFDDSELEETVRNYINKAYGEDEVYAESSIISGARYFARELHNRDSFAAYITRRPGNVRHTTALWLLKNNMPMPKRNYLFHVPRGSCKGEVMSSLSSTVIVEDSPSEATSLVSRGHRVLMPNRPWNRNFEHYLVSKFDGWQDALGMLTEWD